ncbi:MAG: FlgD immunoglobulin-like domain containing protein [Candidatus Cloacimonetes bacterium]|nr:FlgD immunoglobulin-like domain containing protein [Candidatus Cloacimonadota bacterium]
MKKSILLFLVCFALASFLLAENVTVVNTRTNQEPTQKLRVEEEVIVFENFEDGLGNWVTEDATLPPHQWHLSNTSALTYQGTGYSWFMGNPELGTNGGYTDGVLIYLQTPAITVPSASSNLTFKVNFELEEPAVHEGYDGWDAANVRISTDGENWTVLEPTGLPYNCTSMYGFGYNGEGEGVAGWGGSSDGWQDVTVDLSSYAGDDVMIRFVFGSDPAYNTADDPDMFGILVDNITLGDFSHDFNDNQLNGMTVGSSIPVGGDLWHTAEYDLATSGTYVLSCNNANDTYEPNMRNYIYSEVYDLPSAGDIRADFQLRGTWSDNDTEDLTLMDYFGWEISPDAGANWYAMSNPYGDPNGDNYVFSNAPEQFQSMVESYTSIDGIITDYAGQSVQFRWYFKSDSDAPMGEAIMIDDFRIYHKLELLIPQNLTAEYIGDGIELNWDDPNTTNPAVEGWITQGLDTYTGTGIGVNAAAQFSVAHRFTSAQLNEIQAIGGYLTKVSFIGNEATATYSIRVWTGGSTNNPGTTVVEQNVTNFVATEWVEVELNTPVLIEPGQELWFGYYCDTPSGYPLATDGGPVNEGFGNVIQFQNSWTTLTALGDNLEYNWMIKGYVATDDGRVVLNKNFNTNIRNTREDVTGYKVYRKVAAGDDFEEIGEVGADVTTYIDETPVYNSVNFYAVTALYGTEESEYSDEATAFAPGETTFLYSHDDGTAESGLSYAGIVLNKMSPTVVPYTLTHVLFYLETKAGNFFLKVYGDGGNQPGEELLSTPVLASNLNEGWNIIDIEDIDFESGIFYIGAQVATSSSKIGIDEDYEGTPVSVRKTSTAPSFDNFTDGVFMIRAYVDLHTGNSEIVLPQTKLTANNYPNPFNPETTISFNIPTSGNVSVKVFNVKGQIVNTLVNEEMKAGNNQVIWNGLDYAGKQVTSGVYFYKVETENHSIINKMLLMK